MQQQQHLSKPNSQIQFWLAEPVFVLHYIDDANINCTRMYEYVRRYVSVPCMQIELCAKWAELAAIEGSKPYD